MSELTRPVLSRRNLLCASASLVAAAGTGSLTAIAHAAGDSQEEVLGQGVFRYRANRLWGLLDRRRYPVKNCHGIAGDSSGRIVLLTNEIRNNLIAYNK